LPVLLATEVSLEAREPDTAGGRQRERQVQGQPSLARRDGVYSAVEQDSE
jgi:hypothetical protein